LFQVCLFCLAIGQDPKELPFAVVNNENNGASCPTIVNLQCPITKSFGMIIDPNSNLAVIKILDKFKKH